MNRSRLGEILVRQGRVTREQLDAALAEQARDPERRIGEILVEQGAIDEVRLARTLADQLDIPFIDPLLERVDPEVVWRMRREDAERLRVIPLRLEDDRVVLAMADPTDEEAFEEARARLRSEVARAAAPPSTVLQAIHRHYDLAPQVRRLLASAPPSLVSTLRAPTALELDGRELARGLQSAGRRRYVELLNFLLASAIERSASDVHVEPEPDAVRVRFRIDGMLREVLALPPWAAGPLLSRIKVVGGMNVAERRAPQEGRASARQGGRTVGLRLSTIPSQFGEKAVIRLLDPIVLDMDLGAMGWSPRGLATYFHLVSQRRGLVLVVGPTGSGKSTTLYATIQRLRSETTAIVTIEDPVEYTLRGITQVQVDPAKGLSFARAIRQLLRQDPDVMVVGEIRDAESANAAIDAASTGHLVLSTLHTAHAVEAVTRLLDLEVPPFLVGGNLLGVVAQRLVRRVCPVCSLPDEPGPEDFQRLGIPPADLGPGVRRAGPGCPTCQYTAYAGRTAVLEVLQVDDAFRDAVLAGEPDRVLWEIARAQGMQTMLDDALDKVERGVTTLEEVGRVVPVDPYRDAPSSEEDDLLEIAPEELEPLTVGEIRPAPRPAATPPPEGRRPRVLVVDDHAEIRDLVGITLEDEYDVLFAADGEEAIEVVDAAAPDAIVLDVMMPGHSGYEVCRILKERPETADIPVLMLSARGDRPHVKEGFYAGADDYLPKPFDPEELALRVRALLRRAGRLPQAPPG